MKAYTITNYYVELFVDGELKRVNIEGKGRNRSITINGLAYLVSELY